MQARFCWDLRDLSELMANGRASPAEFDLGCMKIASKQTSDTLTLSAKLGIAYPVNLAPAEKLDRLIEEVHAGRLFINKVITSRLRVRLDLQDDFASLDDIRARLEEALLSAFQGCLVRFLSMCRFDCGSPWSVHQIWSQLNIRLRYDPTTAIGSSTDVGSDFVIEQPNAPAAILPPTGIATAELRYLELALRPSRSDGPSKVTHNSIRFDPLQRTRSSKSQPCSAPEAGLRQTTVIDTESAGLQVTDIFWP
jgi:hypothetical protein